MTLVNELELPVFDYTDQSMRGESFHAEMAALRAQGWLARGPHGYIVLDRAAAEFFLRTKAAIFPGMRIAEIFDVREGPLYEQMKHNILQVNGRDHSRLRGLVNPALSPRAVERYRPAMRGFLEELLEQAGGTADSGTVRCEFVEAFAKPYPSKVIALVMGAPLGDAARLHHWSNWIQRQFDAVSMATERDEIERAVEEFYEYARALVRARRADPAEDLITALIDAEEQGDRLSESECINLVFNVLVGGVDTSQSQLAHAVRLLAENREQWRALREEPALAEEAVEEALRFEPITPFTARILTEDVEYRGVSFPRDTVVMVCAFTGNRDIDDAAAARANGAVPPAGTTGPHAAGVLGAAERFEITAPPRTFEGKAARPLTFGAGVHYCLGANLARAELQEGLSFLAERVRDLELDGEPVFEGVTGIYGLAELPVRLSLA